MNLEEIQRAESSQRQHYDTIQYQEKMNIIVEQEEYNLFQMLKPELKLDGDKWCVLYGKNLQEGVAGFGDSPYHAILAWNSEWYKKIDSKDKLTKEE